jgi:cytochrome c553
MKKLVAVAAIAGFAFAGNFNCTMCHNGTMAAKLDTLTPAEIVKKTKEFKAGKGNAMMVSAVKDLSDKDIEAAAKEFGKK